MDKIDHKSRDILGGNVEKIAELFPGVVTEAQDEVTGELKKVVDFDLLRQHLSDELVEGDRERFRLDWPGKKASILKANTPITKTLRPVREDSEDFDTTQNIFIEGDNFEVLKVLQESYLGKIKMIYIDPPYNTGQDFIYRDNFVQDKDEYEEEIGVRDDENGGKLVKNTETNGRYHSDWLSMMQERLIVARDLLMDEGVMFISIDDTEHSNLKQVCDEVFGENNFIAALHVEMSLTQGMKVGAAQNGAIVKNGEFIYVYAKQADSFKVKTVLYDGVRGYDTHFSIFLSDQNKMMPVGEFIQKETNLHHYFDNYKLPRNFSSFCKLIEISSDFKNEIYTKYADKLYRSMMASIAVPAEVAAELNSGAVVRYQKYLLHRVESGKIRQLLPLSATIGYSDDYTPQLGRRRIRGDMWKGFYSDMMNVAKEGGVDYKNGKKPVRLIKQLIKWGASEDDYVMDFFAGSATTSDAVMQLNAEDGGNRKHIQVQLAEPTDEKSEAYKAGYKTIPEISRERIRRAAKKIREDYAEQIAKRETPLDTGFRAYKLSSSNFIDTAQHPAQTTQASLLDTMDNIKDDRTPEDLLTEVILDLGLTLDLPIEQRDIAGHNVFFVGGNSLVACFDDTVSLDIVDGIASEKPLRVVFKDSSFKDDETRINIDIKIKQLSPDTEVKVV